MLGGKPMYKPYDAVTAHLKFLDTVKKLTEPPCSQISAITPTSQLCSSLVPKFKKADLIGAWNSVIPVSTSKNKWDVKGLQQIVTSYSDFSSILRRSDWNSLSPISKAVREAIEPVISNIPPASSSLEKQIPLNRLESLLSAIPSITVHNDHIDIPESLIELESDDYMEPSKRDIKEPHHVSFLDAISIICALISTILSIINTLYAWNIQEQAQKEREYDIAMHQKDTAIYQEQIEAANKTNEYLLTLINQLSTTQESVQAVDSPFHDAPFEYVASDSNARSCHESNPTSDGAPDNSGHLKKPE